MNFSDKFENLFKKVLPSPFSIAVILTVISLLLAILLQKPSGISFWSQTINVLGYWENGLWTSSLLAFTVQMMLMLVLGHVLALTPLVDSLIRKITLYCTTTSRSALIVSFFTLLVSWFNWGLGLIFGAILARKVGENAKIKNNPINYPIIGAAGYSGLMIWHGGISGSSLSKIAEEGHLKNLMRDIFTKSELMALPNSISYSDTVFSLANIVVTIAVLIVIPSFLYWLGHKSVPESIVLEIKETKKEYLKEILYGAEKLDHSRIIAFTFGGLILFWAFYRVFIIPEHLSLNFITPNFINFILFGLGIVLHGSFNQFLNCIGAAVKGVSGILIQFPLYFGIMGIMKESGLIILVSEFFTSISNQTTYPILTFVSAGIVNVFVPSGGGQWAIQGPIIVSAAQGLGVSLPKSILALAYGDQITNMMQPFWALPLLGITGLKAKQILPYTLMLMLIGSAIYILGLLLL